MGQINFPDENEWNKIVADAFSSDKTHSFSPRYLARKEGLKKGITMRTMRKKAIILAILTAAAVAAMPTAVLAVQHFQTGIMQTAPYQNTVTIQPAAAQEDTNDPETPVLADDPMALSVNWLPEGLELQPEDSSMGGKYHDFNTGAHMLPCFWKIPKGTVMEENIRFSDAAEQYSADGKTIMLSYAADGSIQRCWVYFEGTSYAAEVFTDHLADEDVRKILENLSLTPAETETAALWQNVPEPQHQPEVIRKEPMLSPEELNLVQPGSHVESDFFGDVSVIWKDAWIQEDFAGIDTDGIGLAMDYSEYLAPDGTAADSVRTWYRPGDGIYTMDETIKTESVPQKVLVVTLTYTNENAQEILCNVDPELFTFENGTVCDLDSLGTNDAEYFADSLHRLKSSFSFRCSGEHEKNNILLAPGESQEVQLAFLVDAQRLGNLYLHLTHNGTIAEDAEAGYPMLDLTDVHESYCSRNRDRAGGIP